MSRAAVARLAWPSALVAVGAIVAATIVGGMLHPGYDHTTQFISTGRDAAR